MNGRERRVNNSCFRSVFAACVTSARPVVLAVALTIVFYANRTQKYGKMPFCQRLAGYELLSLRNNVGAECFSFRYLFLQDLIDSDLPKAVQLFRGLTEQVRTSGNRYSYCLLNDHTVIKCWWMFSLWNCFSTPSVRHLAVTVAPLSHDNSCDSVVVVVFSFRGFIFGFVSAGGLGYESCPGAAHPS